MKHLKKQFVILALSFGLALAGFGNKVYADEPTEVPLSILSIDAGRKYFSEEQLMTIINQAHQNGYTGVQILLGNDGLRFVLDDMSMNVQGKTFESDAVKKAITAGNKRYYNDPNGDVLTETEMTRILNHAKSIGIDIIPVINSPGHMDAILVAMEELGLTNVRYQNSGKTSERTVNIENKEAIAFVQALTKKYVDFFGNAGASSIFNFGADEYANDVFTSPGWGELQKKGLYDDFIEYANTLAKIIKDAGMKPMSFNDGIYYNSSDKDGTFDPDIIISYWTSGWWGFNVAKPEYFASKGHPILNTNDGWYWVLGRIDKDGYNLNDALKRTHNNDFNVLAGGSKITSIGSMQAIWADDPSQDHGMNHIMELMSAFATRHADKLVKPADYSDLDYTLKAIPKNLDLYSDESVAKLHDLVDSIVRSYRIPEQNKVDEKNNQLAEAIKNLQLKMADYSKLNELKERVAKLKADDYENYEVITDALTLIEDNRNITQQTDVDEWVITLEKALHSLKFCNDEPSVPTPKEDNTVTPDKKTDDKPTLPSETPSTPIQTITATLPNTGIQSNLTTKLMGSIVLLGGALLLKRKS
ncbi:family 20 glycosylhydrolase [Erysipelothrix enhydrae]|uniref:family 20 glycosylhydrolase n=1 Tax=Erysipelothrix enhydrae TaxID=2890314 RepID=UPI002B253E16|nr:family 20 glycosylhydrolase [Erysipelothrix sp. 4322-04]WRB86707.1 family 20 glycosylhydrolase [Erysipelothrix sp. 4322-04]